MKTDVEIMESLQQAMSELLTQAEAGDDDAHIEWAFSMALYKYLAAGHKFTDLGWFKETPFYTGNKKLLHVA